MNILHLVFHPNLGQSRVNKVWAGQIADSGKVTTTRDLYAEYPDFMIDAAAEQALLVAHDRIVLQFPFYWYSVPPLLKKYLDDVLSFGFAYGTGGDRLAGKELQLVISVGGPQHSYMPGGYNNFSVTEYLRPLQQTAALCRMVYLPPMWMHSSVAADDKTIADQGAHWVSMIDDPERADPWVAQRKIMEDAVSLT